MTEPQNTNEAADGQSRLTDGLGLNFTRKIIISDSVKTLLNDASKAIKELLELCESSAREGIKLNELHAHKFALTMQKRLREEIAQMGVDFDTVLQANEVTKPITVTVVIDR